ncbi:MAG: copper oxidase [Alphaproteobacteria bacterium]|nr:copper oxidase [Alphaproteobacteria bacterium]
MTTRRAFLAAGAVAGGAAASVGIGRAFAQGGRPPWGDSYSGGPVERAPDPPGRPQVDYLPVVTPNGAPLAWRDVDGAKVFHLTVDEVEHEFAPGLIAKCWGYDGRVNATTIEAVEGDRVRIYVTNRLPAPTTVHWHGIYLPNGMDGVSGLTQRPIPPGDTFKYEWTLRQSGTFMYHSHHDTMTQEGMGLTGMFIIHPRNPGDDARVDRDFSLLLNEYRVDAGTYRPVPNESSEYNVLTINGRAFPGTAPMVAKLGDRVRIRIGNLSQMDHHPIHLHGYRFRVAATDGERISRSAQWPETTVLVAVGQTREIEFVADAPGDWAMHCHMTHHMMNQMGHGTPNMVGVRPGNLDALVRPLLPRYMTMGQAGMGGMTMPLPENTISMAKTAGPFAPVSAGGMFTVLKVREGLDSYDDPGWYRHPDGTVAEPAIGDDLSRDGIET